MITNLFSVFDPRTAFFSLSWIILIIILVLTRSKIWKLKNPLKKVIETVLNSIKIEVKFTLSKTEKRTELLIIIVFSSIILINFRALYPQVFSITSHLTVTLPVSIIFWLSLILFGWTKNTNHILSHLLPQGTPTALMSFIVIIELTRNLIRPITLCVRLTANLIAGHLLMSLLGNFIINVSSSLSLFLFIIPIVLTILEAAVACIQAYVFITLITLYTTETK